LEYNVAMTETINKSLVEFLLENLDDEEICFAIWYQAEGSSRYTALIHDIILPQEGDRIRHGTVSAMPQYVDRARELAREREGGLAMIHTHPLGGGHQGVSAPDLYYEQDVLAREIFGVTGLPLVGMTLAGDTTWSARIYPKPFKIKWCSQVRVVGKYLTIDFHPREKPQPTVNQKLLRTKSVWGEEKQADIMRLNVGIIGAGSVGSAVGEALARLGISKIILMDYDKVKTHNLDRMNCVTSMDVGQRKIDVVKLNLEKSATNDNFHCEISDESIVEEKGYKKALDCDVLFSCVDRPWPRQALNHLSYSCLIPVIDGGIDFSARDGKLLHGMYRTQTVGPERPCLICLRAVDLGQVQMDRDGKFDDPEYIKDLEKRTKIPTRQNIMPFVFALAGMETIHFSELVTGIGKMGDLGQQPYNYYPGDILPIYKTCVEGCETVKNIGLGDSKKPFLGIDKSKLRETKNQREDKH